MQTFQLSRYFDYIDKTNQFFKKDPNVEKAIDILFDCWKNDGVVYTMGCGGSASTATHFACDIAKTVIAKGKKRMRAIALVDNIPLVSAWTNDSGWGTVFSEQLDPWLTQRDVLVGFSVHGGSGSGDAGPWSQNLVSAMKLAKERGAKIIGCAGFDGGAMTHMSDAPLIVPISEDPYGTPGIEGYHLVLHHGIIFALKEKIKASTVS